MPPQSIKGPPVADPVEHPGPMPYWIEVKASRSWSSAWEVAPSLWPVRCVRVAGSMGRSRLEFFHRYGRDLFESITDEPESVEKLEDLSGYYVRLMVPFGSAGEALPLFTGRVEAPQADVEGDQLADDDDELWPEGVQRWVAYGPERTLERIKLNESWWRGLFADVFALDSQPDFNLEGADPGFVGNRSLQESIYDCYLFGGHENWNARQIHAYAFKMIVEQAGVAGPYIGPVWQLGTGLLDWMQAYEPRVRMEGIRDVFALERRIFGNQLGVDFVIQDVYRPGSVSTEGFVTEVFALVPDSAPFGGYDGPVNENRFELNVSDDRRHSCQIEYGQTARADKIRLLGDFCRVVLSLGDVLVSDLAGMLFAGWTAAEEAEQNAGDTLTVDPKPQHHDAARASSRFDEVYRRFRAGQEADPGPYFSFAGGDANPNFLPDGTLHLNPGHWQIGNLSTLPQLPLELGVDYTTDPPTNRRPVGERAEYLPPIVFARDPISGRYLSIDQLKTLRPDLPNVGVRALDNELGVRLGANPGHLLARNSWASGSPAGSLLPDPDSQGLAWRDLIATLALETDHRLMIEQELPASEQAGDGSVHVEHVPIAQFWWLTPYTVVDVDVDGTLLRAPAAGTILRDDRNLLYSMMAGAIARYLEQRVRCTITSRHALEPWHLLIGQMLDIRGEQGTLMELFSPITSVVWTFGAGELRTSMQCGQKTR